VAATSVSDLDRLLASTLAADVLQPADDILLRIGLDILEIGFGTGDGLDGNAEDFRSSIPTAPWFLLMI
jgi:hypothetical protein